MMFHCTLPNAFIFFACFGVFAHLFCVHYKVTLVLPIPDPERPEQHEPWCPLGKQVHGL